MSKFDYLKHTVYLALSGSRAYGTFHSGSDFDYKGIIIPPTRIDSGFLHKFEQVYNLDGYGKDSVAYDIRKFIRLLATCNPNMIETLFVEEDKIVINSKYGKKLRENRNLFLSKKVRYSFGNYAKSQMNRMKLHKGYADKEREGVEVVPPSRVEMGLPIRPLYTKDVLNSIITMPHDLLKESEKEYVEKERLYHLEKSKYDKYISWKEERNEARAELEMKFGYDTKHAMHLIRLLTMCEEILRCNEVIVTRPDASMLIDIRNGLWTYEDLMKLAEQKNEEIEEAAAKTTLPDEPDMEKLNDLCVEIVDMYREN